MKKSNKDKKSIIRSISLKFITMALSLGVAILLIFVLTTKDSSNKSTLDPEFVNLNNYYNGRQAHIKNPNTTSSTEYISMTNAASANSNNGKTITISDYNELYLFSSKCNSNTAFLGYNYVLNANIDYKKSGNAFIPVGWKGTAFTGTFDGQGYEINDLYMTLTNTSGYPTMKYFSMFSIVGSNGIVTNLGLNNPDIRTTDALDAFAGEGGVSYLVGENNGTVSNSFIVDERSADESKGGIAAGGGCRIADLCVVNNNSLTNNYVITGIVVNKQTTDYIEFTEIALKNNKDGNLKDNFYYNASIQSFDNGTVVYKDKYNIDTKTGQNIGTHCTSVKDLITKLKASDNTWYTADSYPSVKDKVGIDYAIRRGVSISGYEITINNEKDFAYMYELFNTDDYMASDKMSYKITSDLDLSVLPVSTYSYDRGIGATIYGASIQGNPTLVTNNKSEYPTIYNADVMNSARVVKNAGVDCYGLFNFVTGTIENLNIVPLAMDLNDVNTTSTSNIKGIGAVSGYVEGGQINNVNVYATISNSTNKNIGEYCLGGVTGVLGGNGKITNTTTAGSITLNSTTNTISGTSSYFNGIAIGGVVGYVESSLGTLYTCLNAMNITSYLGTDTDYAIGGVIGAGYTTNSLDANNNEIMTSQLENLGTITVGSSTYHTYSTLYVSGIIGRHLGVTNEVGLFTNSGTISVYAASKETYVSGVENADILSSATSTGRQASQFKNTAGNTLFYASSFTNGGNVTVDGDSTYLQYTDVLNIKASNGIVSTVSNLFNLSYYAKYDETITYQSEPFRTNYKLADQTIAMNTINTFAPVLNVVGGSATNTTTANRLYNLRNINYTISSSATKNFTYAGVALGEYINYDDCRNEGNLTFTLNQAITGNLTVSGLFNEVSSGATANDLYNAGNITINYTAIITGNVYASGICYSNRNGISSNDISKYNPSSDKYDNSSTGSINNAINSGEILIKSDNFSSITYSTTTILSPNGQSNLGNTVETTYNNSAYINGSIFAAGITDINESVITNAFNIANITAVNYVISTNATREINTAGISILNIGQFAYILNSANDGDIKAYNMSSGATYLAETNAAGISCRNDELENGNSYTANSSNPNSSQVISFTINYGSIYSYNYKYNFTSTSMEPSAKSAGILAMGLCNVINVVNYGNVYGSETASGIFGIVYFVKFKDEVNSNIYIANTLNYGNVYILERGYNHVHGSTYDDYSWIEYPSLMSLTIDSASQYALTSVVRNTDYISVIGSIFSIINFANADNTDYIIIRYLISFNEEVSISGAITAYPLNADPDVSSFYSAHKVLNAKSGANQTDGYMGNFVQYAPLNSKPYSGLFVTDIDANDNVTTEEKTFEGVFSENFAFMQAIDGNGNYINASTYKTDIFISDYFEFIGAVYANSILLDKIGWSDITYNAAAEAFATSLDGVAKFITYINGLGNKNHINTLVTNALSTDTWISKCDNSVLIDLTETLIANENNDALLAMLDYIFTSSSSSYSMITTATRNAILEEILAHDSDLSYSTLLDNIITYVGGYSSLLADSVLNKDEAGEYLFDFISNLDVDDIENILTTYCEYLEDASTNSYFTYSNSEQIRYALLTSMFENIADNSFYEKLADIIGINTEIQAANISTVLRMYEGYSTLTDSEKTDLFRAIILNNTTTTNVNRINTYIQTMASEINYFNRLIEKGYSKTSFNNIYTDVSVTSGSSISTAEPVIDERVKLWNLLKDTTIFRNYLNEWLNIGTIYDLATEYNNTYQSVTEPHNDGTYIGNTSTNRLSYMYTTEITPQVYFYGPYTDKNGNFTFSGKTDNEKKLKLETPVTNYRGLNVDNYSGNNNYQNTYFSLFHSSDESLWSSNEIMLSRGGYNSTTTFATALNSTTYPANGNVTYPYPMLIYYDYNNEQLGGANATYTTEAAWYSGDFGTGHSFRGFSSQQFKYDKKFTDPMIGGSSTYESNDWTGTLFGTNDLYMYVSSTGETFSLNNAVLAKSYRTGGQKTVTLANGNTIKTNAYRCYIQDSDGAYHLVQTGSNSDYDANATIQIGKMVDGHFVANHTLKNYYNNNNTQDTENYTRKIYSFISYIAGLRMYTSTVSPSYHSTGRTGIYRRSGGWNNYFTWKQKDSTRVFTSQYIDYKVSDLLNLDGYLTEYGDGTYKSTDERNIINRIFNEKIVPDYLQFQKIVAAALLELSMYDSNGNADINYIDNFFITNIYSNSKVDNVIPLEYLYQSYTNNNVYTTVMSYLTSRTSDNPDYKKRFIAYCASNQSAYAKLILELIKLNADDYSIASIISRGIGSSSDPGSMSIPNITSYSNAYFSNTSATINNESFTYGMKFDEVNFGLQSGWKKIYLYCMPTETSATLNVQLDSNTPGTDYVITSNSNNYIEITLDNNSSLKLSANNDVILYKVLVNYDENVLVTKTVDTSFNIRNSTAEIQTNMSVTIPTLATIENNVINELTTNNISYSNLVINNVTIDIECYNAYDDAQRIGIGLDDQTMIQYTDIAAYSSYKFNTLNGSTYYGTTINAYYRSRPNWYQYTDTLISKCDINVNYSYDTYELQTTNVELLNNTTISNAVQNSHTKEDLCNKTLDESLSYSTKYNTFIIDALFSLLPIDYSSTLANPVHNGTASKNIIEILGLSESHTDNIDPEYCVPDFLKLFITSSNSAFKSFIDDSITGSINKASDYEIILNYLVTHVGYYSLNDAIKAINTNLQTISKFRIAAAYLVTDYQYILDSNTSIADSKLADKINSSMNSEFQYINSNGTYDPDKFTAFCYEIGYDLSTAGYGIYALASNQGKLNGLFIPDNLDITTKDPYYETETVESSDILVLQSSTSNEWRGGETVAQNDTSSINYAFFKDMKQIDQSISTTVFELDINYKNDTYYGDIDLDKKTVTYYVPSIVEGAYTITNIKLAAGATSNLGTTISVTSTSDNVTQDSFKVTAQNTNVEATYTVIFKTIDVEFTLKYKDNSNTYTMTADASDTTIELKVTSNENKKLPEGLNLEHYISFVGIKNTYDMSSQYLTISALSTDHRVDSNGNAIITIVVSNKLPADTYEITLSFAGHSSDVDFNKSASSTCVIESMTFEGSPVSISSTMNSTVQFGRAYDYSELTDYTSDDFYLYNFKYSNNASIDITATKSVDSHGLMTYDVKFVITAENGTDSNTYHHLVKEKQFFNENSTYASIYATGETVGKASGTVEEEDRHKYLSDGTLTYILDDDTYVPSTDVPDPQTGTWSLNDSMKAEISFNRGIQPQYRIKYNLSNFYTLGVSVQMGPTSATLANGAAVNPTYAGLTVTVTNNNDTGTYVFVYTYTNTGTWVVGDDEVTYTRYYEFPELVIKKLASTDALLHQLTFLEEYVALGNTATVILPDNVLVPDKSDVGEGSIGYNSDDALYEDEFNSTTRSIRVASDEIIYNNNSDAKNISDYYAIGTVSDADLSYYCPTFSINPYAQMYQYTTYLKLTEYGVSQTKKDETVLTNHDNMYLYVPYEKNGESFVFLVELDSDGYWTNVYTTEFNGKNGNATGIKIGTYTAGSVTAKNAKNEGNIAGYTVADYAGQATDNQSLFMDYIGTPHQGHFWYVSYVIFSEDKLTGGDDQGNVRYYHISIIDATNNIQFNVTVYADNDLDLTDIYLTISENIYKEGTTSATYVNSRQISAYAVDTEEVYSGSRTDIAGYKIYELKFSLQTLPKGYFYFYIDLPDGFVAITHTDMANQLGSSTDKVGALVETGAFLPYTSIITQKIALEFIVNKGEGEQAGAWAVNTTDISSKDATYSGLIPA